MNRADETPLAKQKFPPKIFRNRKMDRTQVRHKKERKKTKKKKKQQKSTTTLRQSRPRVGGSRGYRPPAGFALPIDDFCASRFHKQL